MLGEEPHKGAVYIPAGYNHAVCSEFVRRFILCGIGNCPQLWLPSTCATYFYVLCQPNRLHKACSRITKLLSSQQMSLLYSLHWFKCYTAINYLLAIIFAGDVPIDHNMIFMRIWYSQLIDKCRKQARIKGNLQWDPSMEFKVDSWIKSMMLRKT